MSWLFPQNAAVSLYSENPPFTKEALTLIFSLPEEVSVENLLLTIAKETVMQTLLLLTVKALHTSSFEMH